MYLEHFQLRSQPFCEHAAATGLWQDQRMKEGLARLDFLITMGELGMLTGPSGVGKSALLKRFLHGLTPQQCEIVYCHLTHLPANGLMKLIVTQLGEPPRRGKDRVYEQILERAQRAEGSVNPTLTARAVSRRACSSMALICSTSFSNFIPTLRQARSSQRRPDPR